MKALSADKIFDGTIWLMEHAILIDNEIIQAVVPIASLPGDVKREHYNGLLVPSFIDLQIYGAYKQLFAVEPTADSLFKLYDYCVKGGAAHFLPTVATNSTEVITACIHAVKAYWNQGGKGALGLHIEGPWISKAKRGAHIEAYIHQPTLEAVRSLLEVGKGVIKMITLAPEECSAAVIDLIASEGIVVSAGHSNASYEQATEAFDKGIYTATHLFNAMSPLSHRAPGVVGAILNHDKVMASIIPDGFHVDYAAISIAKKIMKERLFIITDAVTETKEGLYPHQLLGEKYESEGVLSGSALTMAKAVKNCVTHVGISVDEALLMASLYPATVLGLHEQFGQIGKGFTASFTLLDDDLEVVFQGEP